MRNIALEVEKEAAGEPILAAVLGDGKLITWEEARKFLDFDCKPGRTEYGDGGPPVFAWTASRVIFVHEYDSMTTVVWVPRNPLAIEASYSGI